MNKHFHKALVAVITFMTVVGFYVAPAQAALMGNAKVQLSNPRPAGTSRYIFSMAPGEDHAPKGIKMSWKTSATGGGTPVGLGVGSLTIDDLSDNLGGDAGLTGWTVDGSQIAAGYITMVKNSQASVTKGTSMMWTLSGIINPNITQFGDGSPGCTSTNSAGTGAGNLSAGTCFIEVQTYDNVAMAAGNTKDVVVLTYDVTADVVMTAKIDPALTFVVAPVIAGTTVATANTQSTTTNGSTFNGLDFKTLTPNAIRLLAHSLYVRTNANNGFMVYGRMTTQLTGTSINTNNVDPYAGSGALATAPAAWASPTSTTKNVDSGWLGYNTSQYSGLSSIANFSATTWAPLSSGDPVSHVGATQPHIMFEDVDQNDGITPVVVSYALEVDVYQPSDSYAGVLQYNVVPKY